MFSRLIYSDTVSLNGMKQSQQRHEAISANWLKYWTPSAMALHSSAWTHRGLLGGRVYSAVQRAQLTPLLSVGACMGTALYWRSDMEVQYPKHNAMERTCEIWPQWNKLQIFHSLQRGDFTLWYFLFLKYEEHISGMIWYNMIQEVWRSKASLTR